MFIHDRFLFFLDSLHGEARNRTQLAVISNSLLKIILAHIIVVAENPDLNFSLSTKKKTFKCKKKNYVYASRLFFSALIL